MKWIDQQEDYFLRDYNDSSATSGSAPVADDKTAPSQFSFSDTAAEEAKQKEARRRRRRRRRRFAWFFIIVLAVLAVAFYIRYFIPYTSDTLTTGYINLVEKRGVFFKTFEGEMISESMLNDTSKVYSRDFYFSIPNDSLGRVVQSYQGTGRKVVVTTSQYFGILPWRGSQKTVLTSIRPAS